MEDKSDKTYPIRLMFGIGNNWVQGFSVVYERPDGSIGARNIWFGRAEFDKVRFTDEGESRIVLTWYEEKGSWLDNGIAEWRIKEVVIRRDAQLPAPRK